MCLLSSPEQACKAFLTQFPKPVCTLTLETMPASPKALSEWYLQLARHLEAGIPFPEAWSLPNAPARKDRLQDTQKLEAGQSLPSVIRESKSWLPSNDREQLIFAAESARLPETCLRLSQRHKRHAQTSHRIRRKLIYPLFVFHLAAIVLPLVQNINFQTGLDAFHPLLLMQDLLSWLLPLWFAIALLAFIAKTRNPLLPNILRAIPILRQYSKNQSIADFCDLLGNAFALGIPPQIAWQQAAVASRSPALIRANRQIQPIFHQGHDPAKDLATIRQLPKDFVAYYQTGSTTGKLDSMLLDLAQDYQARAEEKLAAATAFYPAIALLAVGGLVAFTVFQFFSGYLDLLDSLSMLCP